MRTDRLSKPTILIFVIKSLQNLHSLSSLTSSGELFIANFVILAAGKSAVPNESYSAMPIQTHPHLPIPHQNKTIKLGKIKSSPSV